VNRVKIAYGAHPEQYGHLYVPESAEAQRLPVVVVIHGGFWSGQYALNLGTQYAIELARAGVVAWNIEYRRVGAGGSWPEMRADVLAAMDALAGIVQEQSSIAFDLNDVRVLGHSAGGHLAVWLAGERDAAVRPSLVVSQAGVLDLEVGPSTGHVNPAVQALLGSAYEDAPDLYRLASPIFRVPTGVPVRCVHGALDVQVPVSQSERYVAAAREAGDDAQSTVVSGEDHFAFLQPGTECWTRSLEAVLGRAGGR
jgi:acetyl esterase/lipase